MTGLIKYFEGSIKRKKDKTKDKIKRKTNEN